VPFNTPSTKSRNFGQDVNTPLVPSGGSGWGDPNTKKQKPMPQFTETGRWGDDAVEEDLQQALQEREAEETGVFVYCSIFIPHTIILSPGSSGPSGQRLEGARGKGWN
jgi:hypothetical protein